MVHKKITLILIMMFLFFINAQEEVRISRSTGAVSKAVRERKVLILFNNSYRPVTSLKQTSNAKNYSYYALGVWLAALKNDISQLNFTNLDASESDSTVGPAPVFGHPIAASEIPPFNNKYTPEIDTLMVGQLNGLEDELPTTDKDRGIIANLKASPLYDSIPDSLKNGKELNYWDVIFDLRIIDVSFDAGTGDTSKDSHAADEPATITLNINDPTSDYNLYHEFLASNGGLFLLGSSARYRAMGIGSIVNANTVDNKTFELLADEFVILHDADAEWGGTEASLPDLLYGEFPQGPSNFAKIYNDLTTVQLPINGGMNTSALRPTSFKGGEVLIENKWKGLSKVILYYWGAKDMVTGKGQLIISTEQYPWTNHWFNTLGESFKNAKANDPYNWPSSYDFAIPFIGKGAFATIQNMYVLLSRSREVELEKEFIPSSGIVGDDGSFFITIRNTGTVSINDYTLIDTVSNCLEIKNSTPNWSNKSENILTWDENSIGTIEPGDSVRVQVNFVAKQVPPCN